jgi:hypothetical protein
MSTVKGCGTTPFSVAIPDDGETRALVRFGNVPWDVTLTDCFGMSRSKRGKFTKMEGPKLGV